MFDDDGPNDTDDHQQTDEKKPPNGGHIFLIGLVQPAFDSSEHFEPS
jgi:hypothetical protein